MPLREEAVPIGGIKVRFHQLTSKRIHLEPDGVDLARVGAAEWTEVAVPPLIVHSLVVAEF